MLIVAVMSSGAPTKFRVLQQQFVPMYVGGGGRLLLCCQGTLPNHGPQKLAGSLRSGRRDLAGPCRSCPRRMQNVLESQCARADSVGARVRSVHEPPATATRRWVVCGTPFALLVRMGCCVACAFPVRVPWNASPDRRPSFLVSPSPNFGRRPHSPSPAAPNAPHRTSGDEQGVLLRDLQQAVQERDRNEQPLQLVRPPPREGQKRGAVVLFLPSFLSIPARGRPWLERAFLASFPLFPFVFFLAARQFFFCACAGERLPCVFVRVRCLTT